MRGRNPWTRKLGALVMALALCVGVLPGTAGAAEPESWEHTDHTTGWTELTAEKLGDLNYTLESGKYYLSSTEPNMLPDQFLMYNMTESIVDLVHVGGGQDQVCLFGPGFPQDGGGRARPFDAHDV